MLQLNNLDKISSNHVLPINQRAQEIRKLYEKKTTEKFYSHEFLCLRLYFLIYWANFINKCDPGSIMAPSS